MGDLPGIGIQYIVLVDLTGWQGQGSDGSLVPKVPLQEFPLVYIADSLAIKRVLCSSSTTLLGRRLQESLTLAGVGSPFTSPLLCGLLAQSKGEGLQVQGRGRRQWGGVVVRMFA